MYRIILLRTLFGNTINQKLKKVLIISYYWPPSGGVSVLRSLKITKYLRNFGWEPIVYHPSNAHYPYLDKGNMKDIPEGITTLKRPILEPFKTFKIITGRKHNEPLNSIVEIKENKNKVLDKIGIWIRGNFFIPDARSLWIRPSYRFLSKFISNNQMDAIFTDGPPHTNTYIGYLLKKKTGIPWLSDYQDPWTQVDYYEKMLIGKRADRIHHRMEQECIQLADKLTIASPTWKKDLETIGAKNVDVVYYGFDESDFGDLKKQKDEHFQIVHTGLLGNDRNPASLIKSIETIETDRKIRLLLVGSVDINVLKELKAICKKVEVLHLGTVSRGEAIQHAKNADLLILPLNKAKNAKGRLPGKLYEYLRTYNPILALGPEDGDAAQILNQTQSGTCIEYSDFQRQKEVVECILQGKSPFKPRRDKIQFYSNENQTGLIAGYLDQII